MLGSNNQEADKKRPFAETGFDYIVTGAGCSGLSLVMHLLQSKKLGSKKILLVDKDAKQANDRTWCFWEKEENLFESIVFKQWQQLWFHGNGFSKKLELAPYSYKLIRGIDFYNYCLAEIKKHPNVSWMQAPVQKVFSNAQEGTGAVIDNQTYKSSYVFNSILFQKPILKKGHIWLQQHFKGWFIETAEPFFDASLGTLMDFRTDQKEGATFFYVLPFTSTKALVEYTIFSKDLLADAFYEAALKKYVEEGLGITNYKIVQEKEYGVIPMTNFPFTASEGNVINIGTAGRQTKASSGYTFRFIQKSSKAIVASLEKGGKPCAKPQGGRFLFYDSVLLQVLHNGKLPGDVVFTHLFKKNKVQQVLRFLDNETILPQEMRLINSVPSLPFTKAVLQQLIGRF